MGKFIFNGISSEDFGLVIQTPPTYVYPERDLQVTHVPGRNGDIVVDNNCYRNVERAYTIGKAFVKGSSYYSNFQKILEWLNSANGSYVRLEDSYDDEVYRLASFQMGGNFINYFDQAGASEVKFYCKPQRYLKVGEHEIEYFGNIATIENPYKYQSLPDITIKNIDTGDFGVLMMSVLDDHNEATSSISFMNYEGNITLSSEDQTVYNENNEDKYEILSLNGKTFPILKEGNNTIEFKKYEIFSTGVIESYSSVLVKNQQVCLAEYKTYAALENLNQNKIFIKSYNNLIDSYKDAYLASSVQAFISAKSEVYKFESFNTLLNQYAKIFQFTGELDDNISERPDWLDWDQEGTDLKAKVTGFFMVPNEHKRIKFVKANDIIVLGINPNAINTVYYYEANESSIIPENPVAVLTDVINNKYYTLKVTYSDLPLWISFDVEYNSDGSPSKINYRRSGGEGVNHGYYWTDKKWWFDKPQWKFYDDLDTGDSYEIFATLTWNTSKKAFVSTEGLTVSTTTTYTYRYCNATPSTLPDYEPITQTTTDEETGVETITVLNKVHFKIKDVSEASDLSQISLVPKDNGYYSVKKDTNSEASAWILYEPNSDDSSDSGDFDDMIIGLTTPLKGTEGFEIFYLESIPDYSEQEDWPDWLDPVPETTGDNLLQPNTIQFKVKRQAYYRISAGIEDEQGNAGKWGSKLNVDSILPSKLASDSYYIYMIDELPVAYPTNRCATINNGEPSTVYPAWLQVEEIAIEEIAIEGTPEKMIYKVGSVGYYKWDSNTSWIKKTNIGETLFESDGKTDSIIYYMEEMPVYDSFIHDDLLELTIKEDSIGNPVEVEYRVTRTGYYKFNNSTNWQYLMAGALLITPKTNESNIIYYLNELNEDLSNLEIYITPRWWML